MRKLLRAAEQYNFNFMQQPTLFAGPTLLFIFSFFLTTTAKAILWVPLILAVTLTGAQFSLFMHFDGVQAKVETSRCGAGVEVTQDGKCITTINLQTSDTPAPVPTPPAPDPTAEVTKEAAVTFAGNSSGFASGKNPFTAQTTTDYLRQINDYLDNCSFAYCGGKLRATGVTNSSGTSVDAATFTGPIYVLYEVKTTFSLSPCSPSYPYYRYTAGSYVGMGRTSPNPGNIPCAPGITPQSTVDNNYSAIAGFGQQPNSGFNNGNTVPGAGTSTSATCPSGYTYNSTNNNCDTPNPALVNQKSDLTCTVNEDGSGNYTYDGKDPDCLARVADGSLSVNGKNVTLKMNDLSNPGESKKVDLKKNTDGTRGLVDCNISSRTNTSICTEVNLSPKGDVTGIKTPPPTGSGGTGAPGVPAPYPGTSAVQCGGENMPKCKVDIGDIPGSSASSPSFGRIVDKDGNDIFGPSSAASEPVKGATDTLDKLNEKVVSKSTVFSASGAVCPNPFWHFSANFPQVGIDFEVTDGGKFCELMSPWEGLIRGVMIAGFSLGLLVFFLKA